MTGGTAIVPGGAELAILAVRPATERASARAAAAIGRVADAGRAHALESAPFWIERLRLAVTRHACAGDPPTIFRVMGFSERERPYNRLLGWLLDPQGDHGAGTALLRTAARALGLHHLEHECSRPDAGIEVRAEKPWPARAGSSREPDLLIRAPRSVLLVEHKVNAGEGEDQYSDYREALARLSAALGADESAAYLLSRRERPAPEGWRGVLSHRDVARWIRETAESPGIRSWARAVLQLSAQAFEGRSWAPRTSPAAALLASLEGRPPTPRDLIQVRQLLEELPVTPGAVWDER